MTDKEKSPAGLGVFSKIIKSPHCFSTRLGGYSREAYTSSLNLAFGRGDSDETVIKNLKKFAEYADFEAESIVSVPQIHSSDVRVVNTEHRGMGYFREPDFACDGYVTNCYDVTLGVKTADCVPILLEARNEKGDVIAVSAIHAGWRGTAARIAQNGVLELKKLGASPERIYAAIGPCISACCFEVGTECRDELAKIDASLIRTGQNGKYFPDLAALNRRILTYAGVPDENIDTVKLCTYCKEDMFYSHRRQNGMRGSMLSVIRMKKTK